MKSKSHAQAHHDNVKHHAKSLIEATSHIADSKVEVARNKLSEIMESVKEEFEEMEEKVVFTAKKADKYVRQNPYQAVGIGVGLGVLLGWFWSRRKSGKSEE